MIDRGREPDLLAFLDERGFPPVTQWFLDDVLANGPRYSI
jgi:hypothetical protein